MTKDDIKARILRLETLVIRHPQFVAAQDAILDLELRRPAALPAGPHAGPPADTAEDDVPFDFSEDGLEDAPPGGGALTQYCVMIVGPAGTGKSHVLTSIQALPEMQVDTSGRYGDRRPVVRLDVPDFANPKQTVVEIMRAVGAPVPKRLTRNGVASRLRYQFQQLETRLLMLDEAHSFVDGQGEAGLRANGKFLKFLLNSCGVPIAMAGEESLEELRTSKALKRRTDALVELRPYSWSDPDEQLEFLDILGQLEDAMGFGTDAALSTDMELACRLYFASEGSVGLVTKILSQALKLALKAGAGAIDRQTLSKAFRLENPASVLVADDPDIFVAPVGGRDDPFLVDAAKFKAMWKARYSAPPVDRSRKTGIRRAPKRDAQGLSL